MALSTLRPATSPRLSIITLSLSATTSPADVETVITKIGNDLRRIADEVSRIEREFEGAVDFTVIPDAKFHAVLDSLNVRFSFLEWKRPRGHVDLSSFVSCRSFSATFIEIGRFSLPLASCRSLSSFFHPVRGRVVWVPSCTLPLDRSARGSQSGSTSAKRSNPRPML